MVAFNLRFAVRLNRLAHSRHNILDEIDFVDRSFYFIYNLIGGKSRRRCSKHCNLIYKSLQNVQKCDALTSHCKFWFPYRMTFNFFRRMFAHLVTVCHHPALCKAWLFRGFSSQHSDLGIFWDLTTASQKTQEVISNSPVMRTAVEAWNEPNNWVTVSSFATNYYSSWAGPMTFWMIVWRK